MFKRVILWMLVTPLVVSEVAAGEFKLSGSYVVVSIRQSDGIKPASQGAPFWARLPALGEIVDFDNMEEWHDGTACVSPPFTQSRGEISPRIGDPQLVDLQLTYDLGNSSRLKNQIVAVDCGGRAVWFSKDLIEIDDRVLVSIDTFTNNYVVLERPLSPSDALALERALQERGHDPGDVDGTIDGETREAIADYARANGAGDLIINGVITRNLFLSLVPN